jgi:phosphatidate cytidylyltransferase
MLKTRIVTAIFLLAGLLGALFFLPEHGWFAFCALICVAAAWEWGGLAGWEPRTRIAYGVALGSACFAVATVFFWDSKFSPHSFETFLLVFSLPAAVFWLLIAPFWLWRKWRLRNWSAALTGIVVLVPFTLGFMTFREERESPLLFLLAVCAIVWIADIAAYFSGRAFGGRKLAPNISPGKTWAGAFGAVIGVLLYGNLLLCLFWGKEPFRWEQPWLAVFLYQWVWIGLAAVSILGDLFESLLKRQAGVKDSGTLLPGHGGILDRIDSLTSTLPCVYFLIALIQFVTHVFRHVVQ